MSDLGTELSQGHYHAPLEGRAPCKACGGPQVATFSVSRGGFSCGSGFKHLSTCSELRCAHGVLWAYGCDACDVEEEARLKEHEAGAWGD